jgi:hypothetical protein
MSRLESFIARMQAQKVLLDAAAAELATAGDRLPGPAIELGLGNGRTFDHLRKVLGPRRIIAFDRVLQANPRSVPPTEDLVLGEIAETAPAFALKFGAIAALVHADLGNGVAEDEEELRKWLPEAVAGLASPGALIVSSTELSHPAFLPRTLPPQVRAGRYFFYRRS